MSLDRTCETAGLATVTSCRVLKDNSKNSGVEPGERKAPLKDSQSLNRLGRPQVRETIVKPNHSYTCDVCKKCFSNSDRFNKHKLTHTQSFRCRVCKKSFSSKKSAVTFVKKKDIVLHERVDKTVKPFTCRNCRTIYGVALHDKLRERPFTCEICAKSFSFQTSFERHKLEHSGQSSHVCMVCGKSYFKKCDLIYHLDVHISAPSKL